MSKKTKIYSSAKGYNMSARIYDKKTKYLSSFEKEYLFKILGDVKDKKVLDVGAGTGRVSVNLQKKGADVTALDVSEEMLKILKQKSNPPHRGARRRGGIKIKVGDAENLDFKDESFDIILATFLIVHLKNPKYFFKEAYRVLKNGGELIITNINQKEAPPVKIGQEEIKIESYYHRPDKIIEMLEDLAFEIVKEEIVKEGEVWVNQIIKAVK